MCIEFGQRHVGETEAMRSRNLVDGNKASYLTRSLGFMLCQMEIGVLNVHVCGLSHLEQSILKLL